MLMHLTSLKFQTDSFENKVGKFDWKNCNIIVRSLASSYLFVFICKHDFFSPRSLPIGHFKDLNDKRTNKHELAGRIFGTIKKCPTLVIKR